MARRHSLSPSIHQLPGRFAIPPAAALLPLFFLPSHRMNALSSVESFVRSVPKCLQTLAASCKSVSAQRGQVFMRTDLAARLNCWFFGLIRPLLYPREQPPCMGKRSRLGLEMEFSLPGLSNQPESHPPTTVARRSSIARLRRRTRSDGSRRRGRVSGGPFRHNGGVTFSQVRSPRSGALELRPSIVTDGRIIGA